MGETALRRGHGPYIPSRTSLKPDGCARTHTHTGLTMKLQCLTQLDTAARTCHARGASNYAIIPPPGPAARLSCRPSKILQPPLPHSNTRRALAAVTRPDTNNGTDIRGRHSSHPAASRLGVRDLGRRRRDRKQHRFFFSIRSAPVLSPSRDRRTERNRSEGKGREGKLCPDPCVTADPAAPASVHGDPQVHRPHQPPRHQPPLPLHATTTAANCGHHCPSTQLNAATPPDACVEKKTSAPRRFEWC